MDIVETITKVGFPIACCIAMAIYILKMQDRHTKELAEMEAKHSKEVDSIRRSVDNNTKAITELLFFLKGGVKNG